MDPFVALADLRKAIRSWEGADDPEAFAHRLEAADEVEELAETLQTWVNGGGFTPDDAARHLGNAAAIIQWESLDSWSQQYVGRPSLSLPL